MKWILVDINKELVESWIREFRGYSEVSCVHGSIFEESADAIISPANSFGIMDGGIDGKLRDFFGMRVEERVRRRISEEHGGELPVGSSILVPTDHKQFRYLISAPTMRVPEDVSSTLNAYLAMRAIILQCLGHDDIRTAVIPGLCALSGRMPLPVVARQMRVAYDKLIRRSIAYSHWREERSLQDYLRCQTDLLPFDLEKK